MEPSPFEQFVQYMNSNTVNYSMFPNRVPTINECLQMTTPSIFENNVMSMNLVLTFQPWFSRLLRTLEFYNEANKSDKVFKKTVGMPHDTFDVFDPSKILDILGYCRCDVNVNLLDSFKLEEPCEKKTTKEASFNAENDVMTNSDVSKGSNEAKDQTDESNIRKDDEYLMDIHPHEAKYFTNPKTGRKVKKLVCKIHG